MAPNMPAMLEAHFGVPMAGAVLNALNTRLDAETIAFMLRHGEAKVLITDREFAADRRDGAGAARPQPLGDRHRRSGRPGGERARRDRLRGVPRRGRSGLRLAAARRRMGRDRAELHLGHHRQSEGRRLPPSRRLSERDRQRRSTWGMPQHAVYLWTLPMFHCNGWCYPWAVTAVAGTHVCLRRVEPEAIFAAIARARVTHLCGAPIVLNMLIHAPDGAEAPLRPRRRGRDRRRRAARRR